MKVFNIQHFSTGDGPGIRTTVFMNGCNLRCPWCHNPEGLYGEGEERSLEYIVNDVMADSEFYDKSGGGVTISGGDPLFHCQDAVLLAKAFRERGHNVVVDTALAFDTPLLGELAAYTDCFFVDIKTADPIKFASVCGGDLETVLFNLRRLISSGVSIVLRIPLIPGFNMDTSSIDGIITLIKPLDLPFTLLPFHRLGSAKYREMGIDYQYSNIEPPIPAAVEAIRARFISAGISEADV